MEDKRLMPLPALPDAVQCYVLDAFGRSNKAAGRDILLSLARRVEYAREIHPSFGGLPSVEAELDELRRACAAFEADGDPLRMREEALDVMATCIRLMNLEMPLVRCGAG